MIIIVHLKRGLIAYKIIQGTFKDALIMLTIKSIMSIIPGNDKRDT
jgi:hypothetical protein